MTYDELKELGQLEGKRVGAEYRLTYPKAPGESEGRRGPSALERKLNEILTTPVINNEAYHVRGASKHLPRDDEHRLGETIRAVTWNIERGQELQLVKEIFRAANDPSQRATLFAKFKPGRDMTVITRQLDALAKSDVVILNEVDLGMKRSDYKNVVHELARELDMNYAFGVEFVEIDPIVIGTEPAFTADDFAERDAADQKVADAPEAEAMAAEANARVAVDTNAPRALHGNAILSRYPIRKNVRLKPLQRSLGRANGCWDWNADERRDVNFADALLQAGTSIVKEKIFLQKTARELRHGGRTSLIADLVVNGLDGKPLTVVNAHIEAKGTPKCRQDQMSELLENVAEFRKARTIREVDNPVLMGGDLNTSGKDGRPLTIRRILKERYGNPEYWLKKITAHVGVPYASLGWWAFDAFKLFNKMEDPTARFNAERSLFHDVLKDAGFDMRGEKRRTIKTAKHPEGTERTLADSNQRDVKGFKTSFSVGPVERFKYIGKLKLDWNLVRTGYGSRSYRMAPHYPQTLQELVEATEVQASDHFPVTVVLPLAEPCLGKDKECEETLEPPPVTEEDYSIHTEELPPG